jgi:ring-1,2-phenylacetyl-CoA epoxidase subunit PaaC
MNTEALKELLYKIADDQLIIGHRNSEWTGLGPLLEEDIAFSSMAQDKVGQSYALYQLLEKLGENQPDIVAFTRNANQFHNCQFVELPIGEYDFSLIRHFLFDLAEYQRFDMLAHSSYDPLAKLAGKIRGEIRYHVMHATTWIRQLGAGQKESTERLQNALEYALPYALGIFEPSPYEETLISEGFFEGEETLKDKWMKMVEEELSRTELILPDLKSLMPVYGGRIGNHTEHLQPLLDEMSEVFRTDPTAEW